MTRALSQRMTAARGRDRAPRPSLPRPMPIGWMTVVIAVVLWIAGSNIGSGWVVILTAALIGAVVLDLVVVARTARRTTVIPSLPPTATTTERLRVGVSVRRPDLGTSLHLSDRTGAIRAVVTSGEARLEGRIGLDRGHHRRVEVTARTIGPLGLAHTTRVCTRTSDLWCRPAALPADGRLRVLLSTLGTDAARSSWVGDEEVRGVRAYEAGDARRSVHWRATARNGQLMVRESESSVGGRLRIGIVGGGWTGPALDLATEISASLGQAATARGHTAEIACDGGVRTWGEAAHHHLATLPPAIGVRARPLRTTTVDVALWLHPAGDGVQVDGRLLEDREAVVAWLAGR